MVGSNPFFHTHRDVYITLGNEKLLFGFIYPYDYTWWYNKIVYGRIVIDVYVTQYRNRKYAVNFVRPYPSEIYVDA